MAGALAAAASLASLLSGAAGRALRGRHPGVAAGGLPARVPSGLGAPATVPAAELSAAVLGALLLAAGAALCALRLRARRRRVYERLRVLAYRGDLAEPPSLERALAALHATVGVRWWRRLVSGQPSAALEVHYTPGPPAEAWLAVCAPRGSATIVESALRVAYPNLRLEPCTRAQPAPGALARLHKRSEFIRRAAAPPLPRAGRPEEPAVNALITRMAACGGPALAQIALTPAPVWFEQLAGHRFRSREARLSRERRAHEVLRDRSMVDDAELRGGLDVLHAPLFFADVRVAAPTPAACEALAAALRSRRAENRLVERRVVARRARYLRRLSRGEGNPLPAISRGVLAPRELAELWQLPSLDYATVPFARGTLPVAPAPPGVLRPQRGPGMLRDALGPVSIHVALRRQNTAVPGAVEQGKSSFLVASIAEDLRRERCAVILLDPKGDAAEAALSVVPESRTCTLLDFADPTCGFNPLAVDAPADVIADYVVAALKNLFSDADIRASSDRYLRNAIIAVLAAARTATLWDAARLLSVGEEGYAYRRAVAAKVRPLPELKEISSFFTAELTAQLADARSATTAKLDAPVNKLARLLNSPSIKRVLLNDSLRIDFDRVIAGAEVLIVKGALGGMGAGNTSVLMQLLVGMLDAALARQQDGVPAADRVAVALKVDEAPLVLNRGFAETMALKRSAGLETVACWQTDSQWVEREVREQLDALFAHRVYFATASARDARDAAALTMAEFSDSVRPGVGRVSALGSPDVRLRLPRHHAVASWATPDGRQAAFVAQTIPLRVDPARIAAHAAAQAARGGARVTDFAQPHWEDGPASAGEQGSRLAVSTAGAGVVHAAAGDAGGADTGHAAAGDAVGAGAVHAAAGDAAGVGAVRAAAGDPPGAGAVHAAAGNPPGAGSSHGPAQVTTAAPAAVRPERDAGRPTATAPLHAAPPGPAVAQRGAGARLEPLPARAAESYSELVELDRARAARKLPRRQAARVIDPDDGDLEVLRLLGSLGYALSSQIHRRLKPGRTITTTQRRLKRLADAAMADRLQFHRPDGGGVPACYFLSPPGERALAEAEGTAPRSEPPAPGDLRTVRRALHASGWVLALAAIASVESFRGRGASVIAPPRPHGGGALAPEHLALPGGRIAHDFVRTLPGGAREEARRFETVRPDATVLLSAGAAERATELLVELDDRCAGDAWANKLERYDHFLSGWAEQTSRHRSGGAAVAWIVFVCRDRRRARECARRADLVLCACRAYPGDFPQTWEYPGRRRILFAAERDAHEGLLGAWTVPPLPPAIRAQAGDCEAAPAAQPLAASLPVPATGPDASAAAAPPGTAPACAASRRSS